MIQRAEELADMIRPPLRRRFVHLYNLLTNELGCEAHVKTIYVGFALDGEMVAAAYPHRDRVEIAMALPEDADGAELKDATHLTWRTMPVSMAVVDGVTSEIAEAHLREAARRVGAGEHDVMRSNEHFEGRVKGRLPRG